MLKNKDLIYDGKRVRNCTSNIAKLNPFEYVYCKIFHWSLFSNTLDALIDSFKEALPFFCNILFTVLFVLFFPVFIFIWWPCLAWKEIKRCREQMRLLNETTKEN